MLILVYGTSLSKQTKHKLQTTQNKIVRNILGLFSRSHVGANEFSRLNWLPVKLRVSQIMTNHMFGIQKSQNVHGHNTRSGSMALFKPRMGIHGQRTFLYWYQSINLWNSLPNTIQSQQCKDIFKKGVKSHFIDVLFNNECNVLNST